MQDSDFRKDASPPSETAPLPPNPWWRLAAGIVAAILTLLVSIALLLLSLCAGMVYGSSPGRSSSGALLVFGLVLATILVPIGGTMLAVRLLRRSSPQV